MTSEASLDALSRKASEKPLKRLPPWVVPLAILLGFGLLFLLLFRDRLLPARTVEIERVVALAGESKGEVAAGMTGAMLFQASGWIEPDPYAFKATALIDGVIDEVSVLEGQRVERGELIATLIDDEAELALERALKDLDSMRSARDAHCAGIERTIKELDTMQAEEESSKSLLEEARDQVARLEKVGPGVVSERDRVEAGFAIKRFEALAIAANGRVLELAAELNKMAYETAAMEHQIASEEVRIEEVKLVLSRTRISSPIAGRVLRLLAMPGQKRMLRMDDPDSSTIAVLYDPKRLQVRVDVPLADAAGLQIGQPAKIRCSVFPNRIFSGKVTRIVGEADLQRNTLQAKVEIHEPSDALRPEMLCRVEFLDGGGGTVGGAMAKLVVWLPEAAAKGGMVWVYDPERKRVERRPVELAEGRRDRHVRVKDGLRPGEWVVISPQDLRQGQRVKPKEVSP